MPDFLSNSSYGEDAMLFGIMDRLNSMNKINLFEYNTYIDIGCYHPVFDNNTAFLYKIGWRGTLVDPNPALKPEIAKYRPLDLFLEVAVDKEPVVKEFMMFNDANSMNTLDKDFLARLSKANDKEVLRTLNVNCTTLDEVVERHIEKFKRDPMILNIDIEGMDYDVITSYSFNYRPLFILIEDELLGSFEDSKMRNFMQSQGYSPVSANFLTCIYMDTQDDLYKTLKKVGYYDRIE